LVAWARRNEDLTNDKTDDRDAMLIGRLVGELRCYETEPVTERLPRSSWNFGGGPILVRLRCCPHRASWVRQSC